MRFKIQVTQERQWYILDVVESYYIKTNLHYHSEEKYRSRSKAVCIAEYERLVKDLDIEYFKYITVGNNDKKLPYCVVDSTTSKMHSLIKEKKDNI